MTFKITTARISLLYAHIDPYYAPELGPISQERYVLAQFWLQIRAQRQKCRPDWCIMHHTGNRKLPETGFTRTGTGATGHFAVAKISVGNQSRSHQEVFVHLYRSPRNGHFPQGGEWIFRHSDPRTHPMDTNQMSHRSAMTDEPSRGHQRSATLNHLQKNMVIQVCREATRITWAE